MIIEYVIMKYQGVVMTCGEEKIEEGMGKNDG